jgi:curved DNA-binding protein CbpA
MTESSGLSADVQRRLVEVEKQIAADNYFGVLGLHISATADEVRQAFRELSKVFHPDRYFGQNLGELRARLETVFKKIIEANQVLTDPPKRSAYLVRNPHLRSAASGVPVAPQESERDRERQARLSRHPYLAKMAKVTELLKLARENVARQEFSQAFSSLNAAAQIDPAHSEVRQLLVEVKRKNELQRSEASFRAATEAVDRNDFKTALAHFKTAVSANPHHGLAAFKVAQMVERTGGDGKEMANWLQKAVDATPTNADFRMALGKALLAVGMKAMAQKHFDEALRLAPDNPDVKKHAKRFWPF